MKNTHVPCVQVSSNYNGLAGALPFFPGIPPLSGGKRAPKGHGHHMARLYTQPTQIFQF
jgi:hypothetical protein